MSEEEKPTRARVPRPPARGFLPRNVVKVTPADNMNAERLAPMTFNMPRDWHTEFKMTSTVYGISMKELLIECFSAWKREQIAKSKE